MANEYDILTKEEKEMHARLDKLVDIKKPLLPQVRKLTNKEFKAFVKRPRFINDEDGIQIFEDKEVDENHKKARNFDNNLIRLIPFALLLSGISFAYSTYAEFFTYFPLVMSFGIALTWTFIEYFMHRFELH